MVSGLMPRYRSFRDMDWSLLVITLMICSVGVMQIYSATHGTQFTGMWWRQVIYLLLGVVTMWVVASIDYHTLLGQTPLFYAVSVVALLATAIIGNLLEGARRWMSIGGVSLQVSEFVKLVIILIVARYLSDLRKDEIGMRDLFKLGVFVGVPAILVFLQPDLGTALTYVAVAGGGVLIAGLRWKNLATLVLLCGLAVPAVWPFMSPYQKDRVATFIDPSQDPLGAGYQVIQSRIAIGNGGLWGMGVTNGTQTQLRFLPVPESDFVISAFAEEHGFVGVTVVLGLYFLLIMQIVQNAQTAPDRAGLYICMGVAILLLFHILVNVGMSMGSMIVTGVPLPFMSSGGSHVLPEFMMLGLVNNVRLRRFAS